ncbi:GNAT family N-acetyltransferase [Paenibacillus sonchi]|nr:hypothetical protein [Paenibacillus sonchi]
MGLEIIEATVDHGNEKSIRLLAALGFCREEERVDNLVYFYF